MGESRSRGTIGAEFVADRLDELSQGSAALFQWPGPNIHPLMLEKVVRHHDDGHLGQDSSGHGLAADPPLELSERQGAIILPGEDLAVDDRTRGQDVTDRRDLGIALGDELFTARPEKGLPTAPDELTADAIPFPFGLPIAIGHPKTQQADQVHKPERKDRGG